MIAPPVAPEKRFLQPGTIRVRVIVGKNGKVESTSILKGINEILDQAALDAANQFEYKTGTLKGKPIRFSTTELFVFR